MRANKFLSKLMAVVISIAVTLPGATFTAKAADIRTDKINTEFNGSYTIELLEGDNSILLGSMEFGKHQQLWELDLPAGHDGDVTLRLTKDADGLSFADSLLIDGIAPQASTAYIEKKLAQTDLDVLEIKDEGLELTFSGVTAGQISLTALIEPEIIPGIPFYLDSRAYKGEIKSVSGRYEMDIPGSIVIDGVPDALDPSGAFGIYETRPDSGHPDGNAWIWLTHDENYLYAATEWGSDNTYDYGKDFFKVLAETPDGIKEFTQWSDRGDYGEYAFAYTDLLPYEHMCYEVKIPLSELGDYSEGVKLGFSLYGTSTGPSIFDNADTDWYEDAINNDPTEDTFYIATADELVGLSVLVRNNIELFASKTIILTDDINLGVSPYKDNTGWIAIGDSSYPFKGTFDGDSHIISGLTMVGSYEEGLFGAVFGGSVENLGVTDVKITGSGDYFGGVAGKVTGGGSVTNCYTTGEIDGDAYIGGVAGEVSSGGSVENCYSTVDVSGYSGIGGVAGRVAGSGSEIANCYARGAVSGTRYAGGVAGSVEGSAVVANCYATGDVSGDDSVGGITGAVYDGYMEYCYSTGEVSGSNLVGGIAGEVESDDGSVVYCAALNPCVEAADAHAGRVAGFKDYNELFGNYARDDMASGSVDFSGDYTPDGLDGAHIDYNQALDPDFWTDILGWSDTDWDLVQGKLPKLAGLGGQNLTDIASASIKLTPSTYTYDGKAKTPAVEVKIGNIILTKNTDYTVAYANNINIGTATVTVNGKGSYFGTKTATFTIRSASESSGNNNSSGGSSTGGSTTTVITGNVNDQSVNVTVTTTDDSKTASAAVSASDAQKAIESAAVAAEKSGETPNVVITIPAVSGKIDVQTSVSATLSSEAITAVANSENTSLTLNTPAVALTFDSAAIQTIAGAADSGDVKINANITDTTSLSEAQQEQIGDRPVYDFSVTADGKPITDFNGNVEVSIPYTPKAGENPNAIVIYFIGSDGTLHCIENGSYDPVTGKVSFTTNHFSLYMIGYNLVTFNDIPESYWGRPAIEKSAARGLASGVGGGSYDPDRAVTRAEFVQMMQNVLKLPLNGSGAAGYADVTSDTWYFNAVVSAKSAGLLDGLAAEGNNFMPNQPITREEMAVILANIAAYKGADKTGATFDLNKFSDFDAIENDYLDELETAIKLGLLSEDGVGGGKFDPKGVTTRAQAAQIQMNLLNVL